MTQDGIEITLLANIELPGDATPALEAGASGGVGLLFRSEFLFMSAAANSISYRAEEEQFLDAYRKAVLGMKRRPVTIREFRRGC